MFREIVVNFGIPGGFVLRMRSPFHECAIFADVGDDYLYRRHKIVVTGILRSTSFPGAEDPGADELFV